MEKHIMLGLVIMALLPLLAGAAEDCASYCESNGIDCGTWTVGGEAIDCGTCPSDSYCSHGACIDDCESHDERRCYKGDVYWYDSCGSREGRYKSCDGYCRDGRCYDDEDDEDDYYYSSYYPYYRTSGDYYWDFHNRCDTFCNYPSVCSETGRDGCGSACRRQTDGIGCGTDGVCSGGICAREAKPETQQVAVQGMMTGPYMMYASYAPYQAQPVSQSPSGVSDTLMVVLLLAGCVLLLVVLGMLFMYLMRR